MNRLFYLCACSSNEKGGIYRYSISENGAIAEQGFTPLAECNFICFSPDRKFMYATTNPAETGGGAAAYKILPDGSLEFLNSLSSRGKAACYLTCSPDGKFLYCANYSTGNVAEFAIAADGSLEKLTQLIQHTGSGPRKDRQESAHTHCTVVTPDGKFLCVNDLGIAIIVPVLVGLILGPAGVMGLLIGGLGSGFVLAVFMSNSGGAWDNAKKYVEEGNFGGKNSEAHKATVTGDTVGDPFKDTSGPSLNILIKLMSMVSIVMAMLTVAIH